MEKEFKLGKLFSCAKGDVDLQQKDINGRGEFFINSGLENKGIKGRTDKEARVFSANTLTIDFWGNAFYRDFPYKLATHNHVFSLSSEFLKNEKVGLYIEGALAKLPELFSYNNMATWNKLKDLAVSLPVIPSADPAHVYTPADIDWGYMERYIAELEEERVAELEAYLQATGLDDCDLTAKDGTGEDIDGRLPKAASETVTLSLKVPAAMKRALEREAKAEGKSTGAYALGILADGLMATESMATSR